MEINSGEDVLAVVTTVHLENVRPTIYSLAVEVTGYADRAAAGLIHEANVVRDKAKRNVRPYNYRTPGRLESAITTWISVKSQGYVSVKVGIRGNTFAPEGRTFEVGWRSAKGLRPPVAPLAQWVLDRGYASTEHDAKRIAFAMARRQGTTGYRFGERHWLSDAWSAVGPAEVEATVIHYMRSSFASQPRTVRGTWTIPFA